MTFKLTKKQPERARMSGSNSSKKNEPTTIPKKKSPSSQAKSQQTVLPSQNSHSAPDLKWFRTEMERSGASPFRGQGLCYHHPFPRRLLHLSQSSLFPLFLFELSMCHGWPWNCTKSNHHHDMILKKARIQGSVEETECKDKPRCM